MSTLIMNVPVFYAIPVQLEYIQVSRASSVFPSMQIRFQSTCCVQQLTWASANMLTGIKLKQESVTLSWNGNFSVFNFSQFLITLWDNIKLHIFHVLLTKFTNASLTSARYFGAFFYLIVKLISYIFNFVCRCQHLLRWLRFFQCSEATWLVDLLLISNNIPL